MADEDTKATAGDAERVPREHRWWPGGALPCAQAILEAGDRLAYVRIVEDPTRKGHPMTFTLVYKDDPATRHPSDAGLESQTFNDSWLCPPFCGGGGG